MPENPTRQQRVEWHRGHEENCGCRPVPDGLRAEVSSSSPTGKGRRAD